MLRNDLPGRGLVAAEEHERRAVDAPVREQLGGLRWSTARRSRGVEHGQRLALGVDREGAAQRRAASLAVDLDGVVARRRAEDVPPPVHMGERDEPGARAAGALLAPRLGAAAARPCRASASTRCRDGER